MGPEGLLHSGTEAGAGPLHHNSAGCDRQGRISGGGADKQRSRNREPGGGAEEEQSQVEEEAHAQPLSLPSAQGEEFWPPTLEALLLGDSPWEGETAERTAAVQAGAEEQELEEVEGAVAMQQLGTTGSRQTQGEEAEELGDKHRGTEEASDLEEERGALQGREGGSGAEEEEGEQPQAEEGTDLPGFADAPADVKLWQVFGDTIHHNDGTHMDGGVPNDVTWQRRWRKIISRPTNWYNVPSGPVGRRFATILTVEFAGVRDQHWNSEQVIVFIAVVLQTTPDTRWSRDIRAQISRCMDLWEEGLHARLVDDMVASAMELEGRQPTPEGEEERRARQFNSTVLSGRLRQAVRRATAQDQGGVLFPKDNCTKVGWPVLEVLKEKHPDTRVRDITNPQCSAFEHYEETLEVIPVDISGDDVTA
eukprot:1743243-Ditylum_brightwellii.AAC.1